MFPEFFKRLKKPIVPSPEQTQATVEAIKEASHKETAKMVEQTIRGYERAAKQFADQTKKAYDVAEKISIATGRMKA